VKKQQLIGLVAGYMLAASLIASPADNDGRFEYRVLATKKPHNGRKRVDGGFSIRGHHGGNTEWGGSAVAVVSKARNRKAGEFDYR
jgi:hypothetical protein